MHFQTVKNYRSKFKFHSNNYVFTCKISSNDNLPRTLEHVKDIDLRPLSFHNSIVLRIDYDNLTRIYFDRLMSFNKLFGPNCKECLSLRIGKIISKAYFYCTYFCQFSACGTETLISLMSLNNTCK